MKSLCCAAFAAAAVFAAPAQALEIHFYPDQTYAFELDAAHGAKSLVIHNIAIINDGAGPVTLTAVTIDLTSGERVIDSRVLGEPELRAAAAGGAQIQQAGLLEPLAFQFGGAHLLPEGATLSADLTLEPGEALLIASQIFAYRGQRDEVSVRAAGEGGQGEGRLEIRTGVTQTAFTFPLRGRWYNGAGASFHTHHRWTPIEEFAYDFVRLNRDQRTHRGNGARFSDYLAYGEPIYAAAPGRVISVINDEPEDASAMQQTGETLEAYFTRLRQEQFARLARGARGIGGNQVVIDHGNNEFSFYGHLRTGSARVRVGDTVARGQEIAAVGSSGNSTEPHLHFHVCDGPDPMSCAAIPVQWEGLTFGMPDPPRAPQTGDILARPED